jgi:HEAT repeat protein
MAHIDQATIYALVQELDVVDSDIRKNAARTLESFGSQSVPALIEGLQSSTKRQCWESAKVLMTIDDPRWFEPMVEALKSKNIMLGQIALQALIPYLGSSPEILLNALPEAHRMVKPHIITHLAKLKLRDGIPLIISILEETQSPIIRYTAIEALTAFGVGDALDLIMSFADDPDAHVRKRVEAASETLGNPSKSG